MEIRILDEFGDQVLISNLGRDWESIFEGFGSELSSDWSSPEWQKRKETVVGDQHTNSLFNLIIVNVGVLPEVEYFNCLEEKEIVAFAEAFANGTLPITIQGSRTSSQIEGFYLFSIDFDNVPREWSLMDSEQVRQAISEQLYDLRRSKRELVWGDFYGYLYSLGNECKGDYVLGKYGERLLGPSSIAYLKSHGKKKTIEKVTPMISSKPIFISHASKDQALVDPFVHTFLRLGLEVPSRDIFCTSLAGMGITSGEDFRNAIKDKIAGAELVFLLITPNYQSSQMCIAEMGAAWVLGKRVIPLIVPPIDYGTAGILMTPNQIIKLDVAANLDQLKTDVETALGIKDNVHLATWGVTRDKFLNDLKGIIEAEEGKK